MHEKGSLQRRDDRTRGAAESWSLVDWTSKKESELVINKNSGYEVWQGSGKVRGRLLGGYLIPLNQLKGTRLFPGPEEWKDSIIFLEGGTVYGNAAAGVSMMRSLAATGMFRQAKGLILSKCSEENKKIILKVIRDEEGLADLPIMANVDLGHFTPMTVLPIGAMTEIDCDSKTLTILESGVR
jgi:muramoyltetrapeptide carboxypeptidase LdcA involved in peptidoglycan recycling